MSTICNNCDTAHPLLSSEEKDTTNCRSCNVIMYDSYDQVEDIPTSDDEHVGLHDITAIQETIAKLDCEAIHIMNALDYNHTVLRHVYKQYRNKIEILNVVLVKGLAGGVNTSDYTIEAETNRAFMDICTVIERNKMKGVITYIGHDGDDYNETGHTFLVDKVLQKYGHSGVIQPFAFKLPGNHDAWKAGWPSKCNNWEILSPNPTHVELWGPEPWKHLAKWGIETLLQKENISQNSVGVWTMSGWTTTHQEFQMFHTSPYLNKIPWFLYKWHRTVRSGTHTTVQNLEQLLSVSPDKCFDDFKLPTI